MPEKKVKGKEPQAEEPQKKDYYADKSKKATDFIIGFLGIGMYLCYMTLGGLGGYDLSFGIFLLSILTPIAIVSYFVIKKGRRFIFKGILTGVMIPVILFLLLLGACAL